ncbi:hypothetical protein [Nostoc sp.]|uniref:hypothetical protein n=1 Tax=Nostoc sp. TaxID=1180 RepID=UPI002FF8B430
MPNTSATPFDYAQDKLSTSAQYFDLPRLRPSLREAAPTATLRTGSAQVAVRLRSP